MKVAAYRTGQVAAGDPGKQMTALSKANSEATNGKKLVTSKKKKNAGQAASGKNVNASNTSGRDTS